MKEAHFSEISSISIPPVQKVEKCKSRLVFKCVLFSPSDQMIAAMPIVLNLDSRGLSGFIIALYLIMDVF